jgi:hypothetical protein
MKTTIFFITTLITAASVTAQPPQNDDTQRMKAQRTDAAMPAQAATNESQPDIYIWSDGGPGCGRSLFDGHVVKIIDTGAYRVEVSLNDTGWKMRADILIVNRSSQQVDVHPEQFRLTENGKELKYLDASALARAVNRKALWARMGAAMSSAGAAMQTQTSTSQTTETGTVTATGPGGMAQGTYGGVSTTTTTTPDYDAQRRAAAQAAQVNANVEDAISYMQSIVLRPNTIFPAHQIYGAAFFDHVSKNAKHTLLSITVGAVDFRFPFDWHKK